VTLDLQGGHARAVSRESPYAVHSASAASFNTSGVLDDITQPDAIGVAKYHGLQERMSSALFDSEFPIHKTKNDK
jgi:argininosuccinate synthase